MNALTDRQNEPKAAPLTPLQWLICAIAALGFAFDSYVLLMVPLVIPPALVELLGVPPTNPAINDWVGILFYVPAVAGGIFGLCTKCPWRRAPDLSTTMASSSMKSQFVGGKWWWTRIDSNYRPPACEAGALPLSHASPESSV